MLGASAKSLPLSGRGFILGLRIALQIGRVSGTKQASKLADTLKWLARDGRGSGALIVAVVLLFAPSGWAGTLVGGSGICKLPRSPWVPHKAAPENLECLIDEDDDGIDDEIEALLANCYAPSFRFAPTEDTRITGNPTFPGGQEPFTAFNVFPHAANASGAPGTPRRIQIKYATLYAKDGGYWRLNHVDSAYIPLITALSHLFDQVDFNDHPGDSDAVDVYLDLNEDKAGNWTAELAAVGTGNQSWDREKRRLDERRASVRRVPRALVRHAPDAAWGEMQTAETGGGARARW